MNYHKTITLKDSRTCVLRNGTAEDGQARFPEINMICGTDNDLIDANRSFRDKLLAADAPVFYEEGPGRHDMKYWNPNLPGMLDWLIH